MFLEKHGLISGSLASYAKSWNGFSLNRLLGFGFHFNHDHPSFDFRVAIVGNGSVCMELLQITVYDFCISFDNFRLYLDHIEFYALVRVYLLMLTWLRFVYVLLSQVLHMDRNDYYGGESASLNLIQVLLFIICICQSLAVFLLLTTLVSDRFWLWINLFTALEEVQGKR